MQESGDRIKNIATGEEAAKDLAVIGMQPIAAKLEIVLAMNQGEAIAELCAPDGFIDIRLEEEGVSEAECCAKTHRGICWDVGLRRSAGPNFTLIGEMRFIQLVRGNCREVVHVHDVD